MRHREEIRKRVWLFTLTMLFLVLSSSTALAAIQEAQYRLIMEAAKKSESLRVGRHAMMPTQAPQTAEIDSLTLDSGCAPADNWCGGTMVLGGVVITLPRNLLIDFPANRLTIKQIFQQAQPACVAAGQSGLARNDTCRITTKGAFATIKANNDSCGRTIAGDVLITNGPVSVTGRVTFINYVRGYFRINGTAGADIGGTMVRINDPTGTNTIQQGSDCTIGSPNCSPDVRFTNDPINYTAAFKNGYPLCIPSRVVSAGHTTPADAFGVGDPFCPDTNRTAAVAPDFFVQDSRRFAPLKLNDTVEARGGFVTVNSVTFLSAHTVAVIFGLTTREAPDQPDYLSLAQTVWHVADFPGRHLPASFSGFTTLPDSQLDIFALRVDPNFNQRYQDPIASTVGNPRTTNLLIIGPGGQFAIDLDVPFPRGIPVPRANSPCFNLKNAAFDVCPNGGTMAEEFSILTPPAREIRAVTRRTIPLNTGVVALDILGRPASSGQWTQPLGASLGGLVLAPLGEAKMGAGFVPLIFEAFPWVIDRRTSPDGCIGPCEGATQPLDPHPASRVDVRASSVVNLAPVSAIDRILTYFTFESGQLVSHIFDSTPLDSCPLNFSPGSLNFGDHGP